MRIHILPTSSNIARTGLSSTFLFLGEHDVSEPLETTVSFIHSCGHINLLFLWLLLIVLRLLLLKCLKRCHRTETMTPTCVRFDSYATDFSAMSLTGQSVYSDLTCTCVCTTCVCTWVCVYSVCVCTACVCVCTWVCTEETEKKTDRQADRQFVELLLTYLQTVLVSTTVDTTAWI